MLLENGANVNIQEGDGWAPLHYASVNGHEAVVSLLLGDGAKINIQNKYGQTPLHFASDNGHEAVVSLLLKNGVNVNVQNEYGTTPLHYASRWGHEAIVSFLLKTGADPNIQNARGNTPLHAASFNGHDAIVSLLLENGADYTITNKDGKTPLQDAQDENKQNCVAAIESFIQRPEKQPFYRHFDEVKTRVKNARNDEIITIAPIFENALEDMTDFLQLKYYFTAVNAQYRLGTITSGDRRALIVASLEKAKSWCVSPFHVATYRVGLRYAVAKGIIDQHLSDQLDVAALECDIANTDYIQAMQMIIRQNAVRIDRLENAHVLFQQAICKSVHNLQQNLIALHQDMNRMATAINDTQAAFNKFRATMAYKRRVEAGCSLVSAVLNAVSLGATGNVLQGVLGFTIARVADFGDLAHLRGVLTHATIPSDTQQEIGDTSIHDLLEHGVSLAADNADGKLDEVLRGENAIVVMASSAAVFTNTLELEEGVSDNIENGLRGRMEECELGGGEDKNVREKRRKLKDLREAEIHAMNVGDSPDRIAKFKHLREKLEDELLLEGNG